MSVAVAVLEPRGFGLEVVVVVAVTLTAGEEYRGNSGNILFNVFSCESRPIGGNIFTAYNVGMRGEVDYSDIVCALAVKSNKTHGVVCLGATVAEGVDVGVGIGLHLAVRGEITAHEGDRLCNLGIRCAHLGILHIVDSHLSRIGKFAEKHVNEGLVAQSGQSALGICDAGRGVLMQSGDHNVIRGHARALSDQLADLYIVFKLDTDVVDSHKNEGLVPVSDGNGVEIKVVAHSLGGAAVKISRKIRAEGRRDVDSGKSGF